MLFVYTGKNAKLPKSVSEDVAIRYFNENVVGIYYTITGRKIIIPKHSKHFLYEEHQNTNKFRHERARFLPWIIPTVTKTTVIRGNKGDSDKSNHRENFLAIVGVREDNELDKKHFSVILEWRKNHYQLTTILDISESQYQARKEFESKVRF